MKGKNFLKVTGILMIIGSIIGIFAAVIGILGVPGFGLLLLVQWVLT